MSETTAPRASDLLAVRSRVSWGALAGGAMVALTLYMVLTILGLALGIEAAVRDATSNLGSAAAIYSIVTLLISMFFGGWTTSRLAVGESRTEAVLYGLILWGALFLGMLWLLSAGIQAGFGGMVGLASGAYTVARDEASTSSTTATSPSVVDAIRSRYDTEVGGERFIEDLKQAGLSDEQAKAAQQRARSAVERLRDDPGSATEVARDLADEPGLRQAAARGAEGARQAAWWTLVGVLMSLASVIFGSLVGAGELLQPVPILGVRREVRSTPRPS